MTTLVKTISGAEYVAEGKSGAPATLRLPETDFRDVVDYGTYAFVSRQRYTNKRTDSIFEGTPLTGEKLGLPQILKISFTSGKER